MWRTVIKIAGGVHEIGALAICIHDHGAFIAWRRVVWKEWKI
jgi:hypothetical protein